MPLWVFIFGMAAVSPRPSFASGRLLGVLLGGLFRRCRCPAGSTLFLLGRSVGLSLLRLAHSRLIPLDLGVGLLAVRPQHHDHVAAVLFRCRLDEPQLLNVVRQPLEQPETELGTGLLAATE